MMPTLLTMHTRTLTARLMALRPDTTTTMPPSRITTRSMLRRVPATQLSTRPLMTCTLPLTSTLLPMLTAPTPPTMEHTALKHTTTPTNTASTQHTTSEVTTLSTLLIILAMVFITDITSSTTHPITVSRMYMPPATAPLMLITLIMAHTRPITLTHTTTLLPTTTLTRRTSTMR